MSWIRHTTPRKPPPLRAPPTPTLEPSTVRVETPVEFPLQHLYEDTKDVYCLEQIDIILYINLEKRFDRKQHCVEEIKKIDPFLLKTQRVNAVYQKENGALGCTRSHIKALQAFIDHPTWKTCLIMEDDFTFVFPSKETNQSIDYALQQCKEFDVLLLGRGTQGYVSMSSPWNHIHQVVSAQTTSAYLVTKSYAPVLLANFQESEQLMLIRGYKPEYCLDNHWKRLMPSGKWFTLDYRIGYQ